MMPRPGPRRAFVHWSRQEDELLKFLWARGDSVEAITEKLPGRSRDAIFARRERLKLPQRDARFKPGNHMQQQPRRAGKTTLPPLACLGDQV